MTNCRRVGLAELVDSRRHNHGTVTYLSTKHLKSGRPTESNTYKHTEFKMLHII